MGSSTKRVKEHRERKKKGLVLVTYLIRKELKEALDKLVKKLNEIKKT